ncbi:hypothetical protein [Bacillus gaemokensis]|uniref:Uncharacterized protein n=1 Tax=Bacillus gaemokensis TaxID=574375 RepID=A0A073KFM8_9BACI|nr:hypothetical protein [Bacillus gaemokensis]KEK26064.1 hypothetical protein BAGA_02155 [Bacillus gaemokensis]KYG38875.1 hypothetical protein AZF08_02225 [Bacillus gaemokensis]
MYYYYAPQVYPYVNYYANPYLYARQQFTTYQQPMASQSQPSQGRKPYLMTWPYSNVYYGNYYES